jgi:alpha-galactosidase
VDFRWFDAGWYVRPDNTSPSFGLTIDTDWWATVGTWKLDPEKWPGKTFLESTEFARANGMKTLMWFEPERITDPENLEKNFGYNKEWAIELDGYKRGSIPITANNIGNPDCLAWTLNQICSTLKENKVEMYREDCNLNLIALWSQADKSEGENRQGITECKFIDGHYKLWDSIIECTLSYGGCGFVDSCASGGGRNDLESMRRGVPLLRSDADRTSTSLRLSMTTAFNKWIPFCGANTKEKVGSLDSTGNSDPYIWRASYLPSLNVDSQFTQAPDEYFDILRFGLNEWKKVSPYLLKDFYVHTLWHSEMDKSDFTAFSYFDPEKEKGVLLCFRQENCSSNTLALSLPYAEEGKNYLLTDEDTGEKMVYSGIQLVHGITLTLKMPRSSRLIWVEKI